MNYKKRLKMAEWLVEKLLEIPIMEMASLRAELRTKISCLGPTLCLHILNVLNFPDIECLDHWKSEIVSFCETIIDINDSLKKPFDSEELEEYIFNPTSLKKALSKYKSKWNGKIPDDSELADVIRSLCQAMVSRDSYESVWHVIDSL